MEETSIIINNNDNDSRPTIPLEAVFQRLRPDMASLSSNQPRFCVCSINQNSKLTSCSQNVYCNKELKLGQVLDGQGEGKGPFLKRFASIAAVLAALGF
jgi:hypothetical protein